MQHGPTSKRARSRRALYEYIGGRKPMIVVRLCQTPIKKRRLTETAYKSTAGSNRRLPLFVFVFFFLRLCLVVFFRRCLRWLLAVLGFGRKSRANLSARIEIVQQLIAPFGIEVIFGVLVVRFLGMLSFVMIFFHFAASANERPNDKHYTHRADCQRGKPCRPIVQENAN